jgi:hypothetical protein
VKKITQKISNPLEVDWMIYVFQGQFSFDHPAPSKKLCKLIFTMAGR